MIDTLKGLAEVKAGYPFRGSVPVSESGNARVIQMRDVPLAGDIDWAALSRSDIPASKTHDWLADGDVLFVARGTRNYAVCLAGVPGPTVCSQYFFVLRVRSPRLLPSFLAWYINRAPAQRYLASNAEGSDQLSIRRGVLEDMPIAVPPLDRQRRLVELAVATDQERQYLETLIKNREHLLDALAHDLLATPDDDHRSTP